MEDEWLDNPDLAWLTLDPSKAYRLAAEVDAGAAVRVVDARSGEVYCSIDSAKDGWRVGENFDPTGGDVRVQILSPRPNMVRDISLAENAAGDDFGD